MFSANTSQVSEDRLYVEDVFSTWLYTGNGGTQTITNGIDLAGKGGLVWAKSRGSGTYSHQLYDTNRGATNVLATNNANAQATGVSNGLTAFTSSGFSIGSTLGINSSGDNVASWTFREAPKFFDVVTYTGNGGASQTISHNLGSTPGMIILKTTGVTGNWYVWHRSTPSQYLLLDQTGAATAFQILTCDSTGFTVTDSYFTSSGRQFVAYLFAHDTTSDGIIQCGVLNAAGEVNLGWEPQWILHKPHTTAGTNWRIFDNMRGMPVGGNEAVLAPNTADAESSSLDFLSPTATGFDYKLSTPAIYIAIRRGPMRTPTSGASVFSPNITNSPTNTVVSTNFPVDLQTSIYRPGGFGNFWVDRLRGLNSPGITTNTRTLQSDTTSAETGDNGLSNNFNNTGYTVGASYNNLSVVYWNFRRAPSFFDEVCYTGTGVARTVNHNLGVAPELIITKCRSNGTTAWMTYCSALSSPNDKYLFLNQTSAVSTVAGTWKTPTATTFGMDISFTEINNSGFTYVSYLFASCPGVSKVGSYTGNGSSQTINCGFAAGARFVLIKRTDSTGDWYVWDSARGIVAGDDPRLSLNSTAAEVTADDSVDTDSSGFVVNQLSATNINVSSATYIYLAVA